MPKQKPKLYEYIEGSFNNKQKKFPCEKCNEADELMFKVVKVNTNTLEPLVKSTHYICRFHAREFFPYYFRKVAKSKDKTLNMFEVNV